MNNIPPAASSQLIDQLPQNLENTALGDYWLEEFYETTPYHWTYRARSLKGYPQAVLVKVLRPDFSKNALFCRHLQNLVRHQRAFKAKHLVPLLEAHWQQPNFYYVLPLVGTQTLANRLKSGAVPHWTAIKILQQLATGLAALHRQGLYHLEICPANIWLDDNQNAYLSEAGFWAARWAVQASEKPTSDLQFSPMHLQYCAPEQLNAHPLDQRTDLYALGTVFFEMLCGELPYPASTARVLALAQFSQPLPMHRLVPVAATGWQPVLEKLLAFDRRSRFESADQLLQAIQAQLVGRDAQQPTHDASEVESLALALQKLGYQNPGRVVTQTEADQVFSFLRQVKQQRTVKVSSLALGAAGLALAGALGSIAPPAIQKGIPQPFVATIAKTKHRAKASLDQQQSACQRLQQLINQTRQAAGLTTLQVNPRLQAVAQQRVDDMLDRHYFGHYDPQSGATLVFDLGDQAGFQNYLGENLGHTSVTIADLPTELLTAWQNSPTHRTNLEGAAYTELGIGIAYDIQSEQWLVALVLAGDAQVN